MFHKIFFQPFFFHFLSGGLGPKGLCGIPYKRLKKKSKRLFFVTFCMEDYKNLAAIACPPMYLNNDATILILLFVIYL
jgi:hypothetical protein